jgi:hypothetical protein
MHSIDVAAVQVEVKQYFVDTMTVPVKSMDAKLAPTIVASRFPDVAKFCPCDADSTGASYVHAAAYVELTVLVACTAIAVENRASAVKELAVASDVTD